VAWWVLHSSSVRFTTRQEVERKNTVRAVVGLLKIYKLPEFEFVNLSSCSGIFQELENSFMFIASKNWVISVAVHKALISGSRS
jgi:hypothetical protein